jgi:1-deoxy-D-xylulose-5-phosphate synthase
LLEQIKEPNDIKDISEERLYGLANEIRRFLIRSISNTGGHLASNLGAVELTIALHRVYDLPKDKIIWDVGHQAYTHKILTGRIDEFKNLRKEGGISGFPRRSESECDVYDTGHSSTSISAGLGYVKARELTGQDYNVCAVIGDGALTGGMAYEALNNASLIDKNFVIVLNDNAMSISKSIGGMADYLNEIRTSAHYRDFKEGVTSALKSIPIVGEQVVERLRKTKSGLKQLFIPGMLFENMGITYLGPVDGHNIRHMIKTLRTAKKVQGPVIVHVLTNKGKGYAPAINDPSKFHGTSAFDLNTGKAKKENTGTYSDVFSETIVEMAAENKKITAVTAAMKEGTGLNSFAKLYPERFFDVGIAEEHAVSFSTALALGGMLPVAAIYSSFLQRGFDQVMMDTCMQNAHVIFAIDRAGFVGEDGKSHQGLFDLSYLNMMPNMTVMAPKSGNELSQMLKYAQKLKGPVAIRYPKGNASNILDDVNSDIRFGKAEVIKKGKEVAILAVGAMVEIAMKASELLKEDNIGPTIVNMRFVKPFDEETVLSLANENKLIVTLEENVKNGGFGMKVLELINRKKINTDVYIGAVDDHFVTHASISRQREMNGLDENSIAGRIRELMSRK